jgi:uncharacterized membrane protein YcaP (DUF421 family)
MGPILYGASITVAKTAIVIFYLAFMYRILGKRSAAQMNLYDLAAIVAIANSVQNAMTQGSGELYVGIAGSTTLIGVGWIAAKWIVKRPSLEKVVIGSPSLILYEGQVMYGRLKRENITTRELVEAIHQHGLSDFSQVGMAVLEVDGSISVVPLGRSCKFDTDLV